MQTRRDLSMDASMVMELRPRLREFLCTFKWDADSVWDAFQGRIARMHSFEGAIGQIDETSFVKKGKHAACVGGIVAA